MSHDVSRSDETTNFMGGVNFKLNPLLTLKFITASSFFGEPSYYRDSDDRKNIKGKKKPTSSLNKKTSPAFVKKHLVFSELYETPDQTTVDVFIKAVDNALVYDFQGTLELARELRKNYNMRMNPNIIFVRAALHEKRQEYTKTTGSLMSTLGTEIASRPDDITTQFKYYLSLKGRKNKLPGILKRVWAKKLSSFSRYQLKKYLNQGKLIDLVRVSHANSKDIDEMMKTGDIVTTDEEKTWETLKASGKNWSEIINQIDIPHMALLRNLRGMSDELSKEEIKTICNRLISGVEHGKQFPFRYYSAYNQVTNDLMKGSLNECINKAMVHFPKLKGKTISLCDNSGSAHGSFTSSYGSTKVSTIANLSGVMTAINSDEGQVGIFGDKLFLVDIDRQEGVLTQLERIESKAVGVGGGTENGVWLFFDKAIKEKLVYDNIFIYSDQQAGHGGLYGTNASEYSQHVANNRCIDVLSLVEKYRREVNSEVNVFSIQVAGYDNSVLPESIYRGALLSGWTGNEVVYAKNIIDLWNLSEKADEKSA